MSDTLHTKVASEENNDQVRTCAVTGAGGFVGKHLVPQLTSLGWRVLPIRRSEFDISDKRAVATFLQENRVSDIVHLAAESNPASGDPRAFYESNAFVTEAMLEAAAVSALSGRFLLVSATSVYGDGGREVLDEDAPRRPLNHYGASKLLAEVVSDWYRHQLDITIVRPSNCIGQGQKQNYLVPKLVNAFASRQPEISMGDQDIARDIVDIRDATDIMCRALGAPPRSIERVNAASGRATPIRTIIETLARLTSHDPVIRRDERFTRQGDMRFQACSIDRARLLGHTPRFRLQDTLAWMLSERID